MPAPPEPGSVGAPEARLDNPVWHALAGPHAHFAVINGAVRRYPADVAPFAAVERPLALADLLLAIPPGGISALVATEQFDLPSGIEVVTEAVVQQMIARIFRPHRGSLELVALAAADVPAMLALVELTHPGPFAARTIEMGRYLGIKVGGQLVAMTGERMHVTGFTEVSAVCVHPEHRGRGYAKLLVSAIAEGIVARGETPFLHVYPSNQPAIATYEALGFTGRRLLQFTVMRRGNAGR